MLALARHPCSITHHRHMAGNGRRQNHQMRRNCVVQIERGIFVVVVMCGVLLIWRGVCLVERSCCVFITLIFSFLPEKKKNRDKRHRLEVCSQSKLSYILCWRLGRGALQYIKVISLIVAHLTKWCKKKDYRHLEAIVLGPLSTRSGAIRQVTSPEIQLIPS